MVRQRTRDWFAQRIPSEWFAEPVDITADGDEILIVGRLPVPELEDAEDDAVLHAAATRIAQFREDSRERRMAIASEAERHFGRKVSWGARCGPAVTLFTRLSIPVMTRLQLTERAVLDTLVDAGVARSRSDALAWCVRQVTDHSADWLTELRAAFATVEAVRDKGPGSTAPVADADAASG